MSNFSTEASFLDAHNANSRVWASGKAEETETHDLDPGIIVLGP